MKPVTFNIDNLNIKLSNDWAGYETVFVNDKKVSKKFSWSGTKHDFIVENNNALENFTVTTSVNYTSNGVTVSVFKNSVFVEEKITPLFDYSDDANNTFFWGLMFCAFCIIFDWNKLFLLIGVFYMLGAFNSNNTCGTCEIKEDANKTED